MLPVVYTPSAEKYFRKLKDNNLKAEFKEAILKIRKNPHIGSAKSRDLKGIMCLDIYYRRIYYELAYHLVSLENSSMLVIIIAGSRENFYKELKGRLLTFFYIYS